MMGFFDKVEKVLGSKKEDVESQSSVNNEIIDEPTTNDKIRNFKYLDDLIHSGAKEIILDYDIVLGDGEESEYEEGIKLDVDDMAIDGDGHSIDAQGKARIFYCTGKNITIKNIILKNGFAKDGGAILAGDDSCLTITESILTGNTAKEQGGAIYNMITCDFCELAICESTLTGNTADCDGGAIYNSYGTFLSISGSTLTGNTAELDGGAIYNYYGAFLSISGSALTENTATRDGGVIYNKGIAYMLSESTLDGNTAYYGGAIYNREGKLEITKSTLTGNTAEWDGGAILNDEGGELTITSSTLNDNTAHYEGGAIFNWDAILTIHDSTFKDNKPDDVYESKD